MLKEDAADAERVKSEPSFLDLCWRVAQQCETQGMFRFSVVDGRQFYEQPFALRHQEAIDRIRVSVECPTPAFVVRSNVHIAFDELTLMCPDIAIWDTAPNALDTPVTCHPRAVVEVLFAKDLSKDLDFGLPLYRRMGIADILIVDPAVGQTYHFKPGEPQQTYTSPHLLMLDCGCQITV